MKNLYILILLILGLGGCFSGLPGQTVSHEEKEIRQGRRSFLRECGRCHGLIYPQERNSEEWQKILARKKKKVSLTADQFDLLKKFVFSNAGPEKKVR
jgi:hypothetical protein